METKYELPIDVFFSILEALRLTITYDDVRIRGGHCHKVPDDSSLATKFSRNIPLKIPFVSAPMDTVTEYKMAIALAVLGGIGVIHRNLTPDEQARQVARVKFFTNCRIDKPFTVLESETMESVRKKRNEKGWAFHSFPVLNTERKVVGIVTHKDFIFCKEGRRLVKDAMTKDPIVAQTETTPNQAYEIMLSNKIKHLPLVHADGTLAGLYVWKDVDRIKSGDLSLWNLDENFQLRVAAAIGTGSGDLERAEKLISENVDALVIDSSQGDSEFVWDMLHQIKTRHPEVDVVAGNITAYDAAANLIKRGADGLRIGQGSGSTCITTPTTGGGCAQLTAVYRCAKAARGTDVAICADGGIRFGGDAAKAIIAGADNAMIGRLFARTKESPSETVIYKGQEMKRLRGMGSLEAMKESEASRDRYAQLGLSVEDLVPEGVNTLVPAAGELRLTIHWLKQGILTCMKNAGFTSIQDLKKNGDFDRVSEAAIREGKPHDIIMIEEPPNYQQER